MENQDQKNIFKRSKFISGIYTYCDRWCERCAFCSRCMNCALVEEEYGDLSQAGLSNEAFWHRLTEVLQGTYDMLKEIAHAEGIDLDAVDCGDRADADPAQAIDHLISHLSQNYLKTLESLKNRTESQFPQARAFVRPGFDEIAENR